MRSVFNLDGPLFSALNKLTDLIVLNLLFVICSVPVVTVGPALTALSYVTLKMREGEEGYVTRSFFRSFKQNFRQALIIWLIMLAAGVVMFLDFWIMRAYEGPLGSVIRICVYLGALIWLMLFLYVFPLQARFENSIKNTIQNALLLAIANAPKTLLMLIIMAAAVFLTLWNGTTMVWGVLVWLLIGFSAISYINMLLLAPIIHRLMPEQEDKAAEDDLWVVPDPEDGTDDKGGAEKSDETENADRPEESGEAERAGEPEELGEAEKPGGADGKNAAGEEAGTEENGGAAEGNGTAG